MYDQKFMEKIRVAIECNCSTIYGFGHLDQLHLNRTNRQLVGRAYKFKEGYISSTFFGEPAEVAEKLRKCLLKPEVMQEMYDYLADETDHDRYELAFSLKECGLSATAFKRTKNGVVKMSNLNTVIVGIYKAAGRQMFGIATAFPTYMQGSW